MVIHVVLVNKISTMIIIQHVVQMVMLLNGHEHHVFQDNYQTTMTIDSIHKDVREREREPKN